MEIKKDNKVMIIDLSVSIIILTILTAFGIYGLFTNQYFQSMDLIINYLLVFGVGVVYIAVLIAALYLFRKEDTETAATTTIIASIMFVIGSVVNLVINGNWLVILVLILPATLIFASGKMLRDIDNDSQENNEAISEKQKNVTVEQSVVQEEVHEIVKQPVKKTAVKKITEKKAAPKKATAKKTTSKKTVAKK